MQLVNLPSEPDLQLDRDRVPPPQYQGAAPLHASVVSTTVLTEEAGQVRAIQVRVPPGSLTWLEGQSIGVIPPGLNRRGRPNVPRLYSIASSRHGERDDPNLLMLLVKRTRWRDPDNGEERLGVCSNWLCDREPGDELRLTGPVGAVLTVPSDPAAAWILIATGTGIAPFRGLMQYRAQLPPGARPPVWLAQGAKTAASLLWADDLAALAGGDPEVSVWSALSSQQQAPDGARMHVEHRVRQDGAAVARLLRERSAVVYCCGARGMELGLQAAIADVTGDADIVARLHRQGRWRVEVY